MGLCLTWSEAVRVAVDCFSSVVDGDASAWQYNDLLHLSRLRSAAPALQGVAHSTNAQASGHDLKTLALLRVSC